MRQGADVDALEALGREMTACADTIEDALGRLSSMLARTPWTGPDAESFRRVWNGPVRSDLVQSSTGLREAGSEVRRQADDQRRVSEGAGVAPGSGHGRASWLAPPPGAGGAGPAAVPGDAAATVATARSLGAGVAVGARGPVADVPVDRVLDGAVTALGPGDGAGALLAGQPAGRWALAVPEHPGAMVAGVVATQSWDQPAALTGWAATSMAAPAAAPSAGAAAAPAAGEPAWSVLDRSAGRVGDADRVVGSLW